MVQELEYLKETTSQTAGPFVHIGLTPSSAGLANDGTTLGDIIAPPEAPGERIVIEGTIWDGAGSAVKDAVIEVWQADANGRYPEANSETTGFRGWGRCVPNFESGLFRIDTIKPGRVIQADGTTMAPHLCLWIVARGINTGLHTRVYFGDEPDANASDPVLNLIEQTVRRKTLIAEKEGPRYRFDVVLQGHNETVFFDV